ncbi:MAG: hypothetical protein V3T02_06325 [Alphaproteobacteria bacterium]
MVRNDLSTSPLGQLPYAGGAKLVTDVLTFFSNTLPQLVEQGLASRALYESLEKMDDQALEQVGISRTGIPAYVAAKMGYVPRKDAPLQGEFDLEAAYDDRELAA